MHFSCERFASLTCNHMNLLDDRGIVVSYATPFQRRARSRYAQKHALACRAAGPEVTAGLVFQKPLAHRWGK